MIKEDEPLEFRTIDTALLGRMIVGGAASLDAKREWINGLNVFPVPDGDTGTNMCMTIFSAIHEMEKYEEPRMRDLSKAISSGSLRGARGNSGVILSQLIRGFARAIEEHDELDKTVFCDAFKKACETAYKAVMKPEEGTMLTVARAAKDKAEELAADDGCTMETFLEGIVSEMEDVLEQTPEMLPILKQAGVVDAGGQGLVEIFKGARDVFLGKEIDYTISDISASADMSVAEDNTSSDEIKFGYCTEFIINLERGEFSEREEEDYRAFLNSLGDSIVLVAEDDLVKTHVHTNDPGLVLQKALSLGSLTSIKIDNMREQHEEKLFKDAEKLAKEQEAELASRSEADKSAAAQPEPSQTAAGMPPQPDKDIGFIAVSIGDGLNEVFYGLGADYLIEGGQTMNPSTEDILKAIEQVNTPTVFIFPNNKNIIMAANQAADLAKDREVIVIPTKTLPQGITALINFVPEAGTEHNRSLMTDVIGMVRTGQVTYAIRDTSIDDKEIREGDFMGIGDSTILSAGQDIDTVVKEMVDEMVDEESTFICIYYGEDIKREEAETLGSYLDKIYPDCEVEVQHGGQPIYYYIVSVE